MTEIDKLFSDCNKDYDFVYWFAWKSRKDYCIYWTSNTTFINDNTDTISIMLSKNLFNDKKYCTTITINWVSQERKILEVKVSDSKRLLLEELSLLNINFNN